MSEMDFDASSNTIPGADDPVADFLAREQSVLGDLEDDLINKDGQSTAPSATNELNGDVNNEFEQANGDVAASGLSNGLSEMSLNNSNNNKTSNMDNNSTTPAVPIIPAEEPESIKKWREKHLKNLEQKDKDEKVKIEELKQQAKKELQEWYTKYQEQLEIAKKQNRAAEKEWIAERDNEQPGQAWEKISRMCDFNPKTSRNNRDTSRMRSMLLQLKQNPPAKSSSASTSKVSS